VIWQGGPQSVCFRVNGRWVRLGDLDYSFPRFEMDFDPADRIRDWLKQPLLYFYRKRAFQQWNSVYT